MGVPVQRRPAPLGLWKYPATRIRERLAKPQWSHYNHSRSQSIVASNEHGEAHSRILAGYGGLTRQAYDLDLRKYASWCSQHNLRVFVDRRAVLECIAIDPRPA